MVSLPSRVIAAVRVWLGLNDPVENRLHPSHGWLLPPPGARALAPPTIPWPASVNTLGRRP
jgi:hypothetical protein